MLRVLRPAPLLRILEVAKPTAVAEPSGAVHGTVAYDDPVVIQSLQQLTDRMQFRHLQLTAVIGADGLVHRVRLTGSTADGSARLRIDSRLSGFGRPMHVPHPRQGSFLDQQELRLAT